VILTVKIRHFVHFWEEAGDCVVVWNRHPTTVVPW
jgi:hypothetical protein